MGKSAVRHDPESVVASEAPAFGLSSAKGRLLLIQTLIVLSLSGMLLYSEHPLIPKTMQDYIVGGLALSWILLAILPGRLMDFPWIGNGLILCDTALAILAIYLSGNATVEFYLTYFLILLSVAIVPNMKRMLTLALFICLGYGVVLTLKILIAGGLAIHFLIRFPFLLTMAAVYGLAAEEVYLERQRKSGLLHRIENLNQANVELEKKAQELEDRVTQLLLQHQQIQEELKVDLSERKRLQEQLRMVPRLQGASRLAGGVADDLDDLLSVVAKSSGQLLDHLAPDHPMRHEVQKIFKAGDRVAALSFQLQAFSRKLETEPEELDLSTLLTDLEKTVQRYLGPDISLRLWVADNTGRIKIDPAQLDEMLLTLVHRARESMARGGAFTIETKNIVLDEAFVRTHAGAQPGDYVMLRVSDTGPGIPWQDQAHIFEPYYFTKEQGVGSGLGLATVYGIIKLCGGYVEVESLQGEGTSFKIYLPRVPSIVKPKATHNKPVVPDRPPAPTGESITQTVLVVEDEEPVRQSACETLTHHGFVTLEASSGEDAFRLLEQSSASIHVAVVDLLLPGPGGRNLARRLLQERPGLKVLYLSGYSEEAVKGLGIEAPYYLRKPFTPTAFLRQIRAVVEAG